MYVATVHNEQAASTLGGTLMLSVVIPCLNAAQELPGQLAALANQVHDHEWEILISDNGSQDATRLVATDFTDRLPIRVVDSSDRRGRAHACNRGVDVANGEAVLFLDSDDEVAPGYVAAMGDALKSYPVVAARLDPEPLNEPWVRTTRSAGQQSELLHVLRFLPFALGCSLGVSKEAFAAVGGFAEDVPYAEDVDFCWRLGLAGIPLRLQPEAVLSHRYRSTVQALYAQSRHYGVGQVALYRKFRSAGMPRRSSREFAADWLRFGRKVLSARTKADWARWVHGLGYRVGRMEGSLRYRTLYL